MRRDRQSKGRASAPIDSSVIIPTPYAQPQRERTYTGTWGRSERADRRGSRAVTHVRRRGSRGTWLSVKVTTCRCRQDIGDACSRVMVSGRWQRRKVTRGKRVSYTNLNPKKAHQARPRRREPPNASRVAPLALMPSTATRLACRAMPTASAVEVTSCPRPPPRAAAAAAAIAASVPRVSQTSRYSSFCCTGRAGLGARGAELLRDEAQRGALWVGMRCVRGPCASERAR